MSFLTIPGQEGLFRTMKNGKSGEEADGRSPMDTEGNSSTSNNDEEDEDDDPENVRLIPRCSPVPRKRGQSINDETAEYIRIHLGLSAGKRVSFADTTGGDLVDVKEFVAFDSDEDEVDSARWEEEEAKYRKPHREPTYNVLPEFRAHSGGALLQAVRANKVEVEQVCPVEDEPLSVSGLIRVLNISFHKSVYIRSTMDSWLTYFDHPADYVQGSFDGSTDQFSFKLSFAPPYITHGSRIEFVVRYETSDGDYWANNSSMNYVVTLLLSYEEEADQTKVDLQQLRSILKPPKYYSMNTDTDSEDEAEKEKEHAEKSKSELVRPRPMCPVIIQPEIDIEIAARPPGPSVPPNQQPPSVDGTPSAHSVLPGEHFPCTSSEIQPQSNSSFVPRASESVQPNQSPPSPGLDFEIGNRTSGRLVGIKSPSEQENPLSKPSSMVLPSRERSSGSTAGEKPTRHSPPQLVSSTTEPRGFKGEAAAGLCKLVEGVSARSAGSAAPNEGISVSALWSPVAEALVAAEGEAPAWLPPSELTDVAPACAGVAGESQSRAPRSLSARAEAEDASSRTSPEEEKETAPASQAEHDVRRDLMPTAVFLSGVVSLSIAWQEPSALFLIGLLLVLHRL